MALRASITTSIREAGAGAATLSLASHVGVTVSHGPLILISESGLGDALAYRAEMTGSEQVAFNFSTTEPYDFYSLSYRHI
jgi:hypothetical protein